MTFAEWYDELPCDEQAALCEYDVWAGAINTAMGRLEKHKISLLHGRLDLRAAGVNSCIEVLKRMLKD